MFNFSFLEFREKNKNKLPLTEIGNDSISKYICG